MDCEELRKRLEESCRFAELVESIPVDKIPRARFELGGAIAQAYIPTWTNCGAAQAAYQICLQDKAVQRAGARATKVYEAERSRKAQEEMFKAQRDRLRRFTEDIRKR